MCDASNSSNSHDKQIGSIITFKYQELSSHGNPRFPVFLRERPDLTWEDVVKNAKTKAPFSQLKQRSPKLQKQHSILFSTVPSRDQSTGKKIITDADIDDHAADDDDETSGSSGSGGSGGDGGADGGAGGDGDGDDDLTSSQKTKKAAAKKGGKRACKYGANCFRTNPLHLEQFEHPARASDDDFGGDDASAAGGGGGDDHTDTKHSVGRTDSKAKGSAAAGGGAAEDDDPELPADMESDGKKSKDELNTEVDEVSHGVGSRSDSTSSTGSKKAKRKPPVALPEITNGKDSNVFKRKKVAGSADVAAAKKVACFYGSKCYQTNAAHLARFSHPSDADSKTGSGGSGGDSADGNSSDAEIEELREKAQATKLEARLVKSESTTSLEAKEIDAKLAEYFDLGLASDDDEPAGSSSSAAAAAAASHDHKSDHHKPTAASRAASGGAAAAASAGGGGGGADLDDSGSSNAWGIASDGEEEEQVTLTVSKKEWEAFQKMTAAVADVANSVKAKAAKK